jgi:sugar phosphate isomerase/epimerase
MTPGLVSITFRKLSVSEIARLASQAGLQCVEWGGDIHVPHGDLAAACEAARISADCGLRVSSYGSYLRLGASSGPSPAEVVETAVALGAPTIRVWAGTMGSAESDEATRTAVIRDALAMADLAHAANTSIAYEFHANTLTDTTESAVRLLQATEHPAIHTFWQPPNGMAIDRSLISLKAVLPRLRNVHAFHWWPDAGHRLPLNEGRDRWIQYLAVIRNAGLNPDVLLEFVRGDDPELLASEAKTLSKLLNVR